MPQHGHAALPHTGVDPVPVACEMVQAFQTILTRNKKPTDTGLISVTMIHAGEASNVIPDICELQGTVRTFTIEVLDLIERRMKQIAEHIGAAHDTEVDFYFHRNYPPTINTAAEADFAKARSAESFKMLKEDRAAEKTAEDKDLAACESEQTVATPACGKGQQHLKQDVTSTASTLSFLLDLVKVEVDRLERII